MQTTIKRGNPTGQAAGLQDTAIKRILNVPKTGAKNNRIELVGTYDRDTFNAVILTAREVSA